MLDMDKVFDRIKEEGSPSAKKKTPKGGKKKKKKKGEKDEEIDIPTNIAGAW